MTGALKGWSWGTRVAAVIGVALAVGLLAWVLLRGGGDEPAAVGSKSATATETAEMVPASELPDALKDAGFPIYWAGPRHGSDLEVMRRQQGLETRIYIRYLPPGEEAGSKRHVLTVGSYEIARAYDSIHEVGQAPRAILVKLPHGGEAYSDGPHRTFAYLAFRGVGTEIEVFDPHPGRALRLIRSGAIVPID